MKLATQPTRRKRLQFGFTLEEVVTAMSLSALCFAGSIKGYVLASGRAEWAACSIAAQSVAFQKMEQVRAARWDTMAYPVVDELTLSNFPAYTETLDMPLHATNVVYGRVTTTFTNISVNPPLRMVQVDCVWTNRNSRVFTNTLVSYRGPNQ